MAAMTRAPKSLLIFASLCLLHACRVKELDTRTPERRMYHARGETLRAISEEYSSAKIELNSPVPWRNRLLRSYLSRRGNSREEGEESPDEVFSFFRDARYTPRRQTTVFAITAADAISEHKQGAHSNPSPQFVSIPDNVFSTQCAESLKHQEWVTMQEIRQCVSSGGHDQILFVMPDGSLRTLSEIDRAGR